MSGENRSKPQLFVAESLLARLMGDEDIMKDVLYACLEDLAGKLERFAVQLKTGDLEQAALTVHSIKGSAQNTDMRVLAAAAAEIEEALKNGDKAFAQDQFHVFESKVRDSIQAVEGYFSNRA